jgi:hypothetical protein
MSLPPPSLKPLDITRFSALREFESSQRIAENEFAQGFIRGARFLKKSEALDNSPGPFSFALPSPWAKFGQPPMGFSVEALMGKDAGSEAGKWYAETWDGGYVRVNAKGRKVYVIRRMLNGKTYIQGQHPRSYPPRRHGAAQAVRGRP